jgi:ectoine hydroxylase-related dioxygenase (phytanoyl-CoA dioxygenase family)
MFRALQVRNYYSPMSDMPATEMLTNSSRLNIPYLHRYWQRHALPAAEKTAKPLEDAGEWDLENTLLSGLGLNLLETSRYLHAQTHPDFNAFEGWILETNGGTIEEARLIRLRDALEGKPVGSAAGSLDDVPGLTADEMAFWDEHGYVVVRDAVAAADRDAAAAAIYEFLGADPADAATWYGNKYGKSIWVPLLRHPAFLANRKAPRLVKAFAQLWGREDLWSTVDQGGFNPPERSDWKFPGPHVHWDMTLAPPHCFGMQGILYLTDTPAEQGAFSCIPGFHRTLNDWLKSLRPGEDPRQAIVRHPGLTPVEGKAGDLVIWHQALPHASSPNRGARPRVAQYIYLRPTRWDYTAKWV